MQHEEFLENPEVPKANNESSEGATVMAEDGQEVHRGTRHSTRATSRKNFLSKRFMDEVCYISDPRCYAVNRSDPDMHIFNESVSEELLRNMWKP